MDIHAPHAARMQLLSSIKNIPRQKVYNDLPGDGFWFFFCWFWMPAVETLFGTGLCERVTLSYTTLLLLNHLLSHNWNVAVNFKSGSAVL